MLELDNYTVQALVGVSNFHRGILRNKFSNFFFKNLLGRQTATYVEASFGSADQFVEIKIHGVV